MSSKNGGGGMRSTRGASKQRRDQINMEIQNLRELLTLTDSIKERLFQLQVMSLSCVFIRKQMHFHFIGLDQPSEIFLGHPHACKTLGSGFLLAVTRHGKLLAISENVSEYLGLSADELMCQGDSFFDLVDPRDHSTVWTSLNSQKPLPTPKMSDSNNNNDDCVTSLKDLHQNYVERRAFVCRWNASRMAKRFTSHSKFMLIEGQFFSIVQNPCQNAKQIEDMTIFGGLCRPLLTPENAEFVASGSDPTLFKVVLSMDFALISVDKTAKEFLECHDSDDYLQTRNFYHLVHPSDVPIVAAKHRLLLDHQLDVPTAVMCQFRLTTRLGDSQWFQAAFIRRNEDLDQELDTGKDKSWHDEQSPTKSAIYATLQILSEAEAKVIHDASGWLNANEGPICGKKTVVAENKHTKINGTIPLSNTNSPTISSQFIQSSWPDFTAPRLDVNNNSNESVINPDKCTANALNALNWMMAFGEKGTFGHLQQMTTPNFGMSANFHIHQSHSSPAETNAANGWTNGEWAGLMEQMHFFSLPELDNRDLDEFFRQVEEATKGRDYEVNDAKEFEDICGERDQEIQKKRESNVIIARLRERLARKRRSAVDEDRIDKKENNIFRENDMAEGSHSRIWRDPKSADEPPLIKGGTIGVEDRKLVMEGQFPVTQQ